MKKKKRIVIVLCATMILFIRLTTIALASGRSLAFNISGPGSAKQGETITIKVNASDKGITDGKAIIKYDESKLTYKGGKLSYSTKENELEFVVNSNESGKLIVIWATVNPMKDSDTVFTLDFIASKALEDGQNTEVDLKVEYANDSDGNSISIETNGDKDSMTIGAGNNIPDPDPGADPDQKPGKDPDQGTKPDQKPGKDPDSDKGTNLVTNQGRNPGVNSGKDKGTNLGADSDLNPGKDSDLKPDIDKDSSQEEDLNIIEDTDDSNNGDSDFPSTENSTPIMRYFEIFIVSSIVILGFVIFKFRSRFKGKGK